MDTCDMMGVLVGRKKEGEGKSSEEEAGLVCPAQDNGCRSWE